MIQTVSRISKRPADTEASAQMSFLFRFRAEQNQMKVSSGIAVNMITVTV